METLVITIKNDKARKLLQDLEELEILTVMEGADIHKKTPKLKISDLKNKIATPMDDDAIDDQLQKIRNEWQPDI